LFEILSDGWDETFGYETGANINRGSDIMNIKITFPHLTLLALNHIHGDCALVYETCVSAHYLTAGKI
jgi:hypothetical protein